MVSNIVELIVSVWNGIFSGLGSGIVDFFKSLFLEHTVDGQGVITYTDQLTTFAQVSFVMLGIGLTLGFVRLIVGLVRR